MTWAGILDRQTELARFYGRISEDADPVVSLRSSRWPGITERDAQTLHEVAAGLLGDAAKADPFWVSSEMMAVVEHAAATFPYSKAMVVPKPASFGYIEFEQPTTQTVNFEGISSVDVTAMETPSSAPIGGLLWATHGTKTLVVSLSPRDHVWPELLRVFDEDAHRFPTLIQYAVLLLNAEHQEAQAQDSETTRWGCFLGALWTLMAQRIAVTHTERPSRAEMRRWYRAGNPDPPTVRVITLRRFKAAEHPGEDEPGFVDWKHRWIVNGHWRMQWYPSLAEHLPLWIAPYIKGPEDKPLILKRDLRVLVR